MFRTGVPGRADRELLLRDATYLTRRDGVYYARIDVPQELVTVLKTRTKKRSLKTKDKVEAKRLVWPVITEWQREFDELRARRSLVDADRQFAVWEHYTAALDRDESERAAIPGQADLDRIEADLLSRIEKGEITGTTPLSAIDATLELKHAQNAAKLSANARRAKLAELKKHLSIGETALIAHEVEDYLKRNGLSIERSSLDWISLARHLMRAEMESLERSLERDLGDFTGQPRDPLVKPPTLDRRGACAVAAPGESIAESVAAFKKENPRNVSKSRIEEACRDISIFIDTVGPGFPVANISKKQVREWKALLIEYPVRATEVTEFRGMTMAQTVEANREKKRPVLSDRTVNRYLSSLSAFCSWAEANGYISANPCSGMALPKERRTKTLPFSTEQLNI